ncbi:phosphate/phosphite/phosphonate ABC transporter substrate-binding protein [Chitinibacter sp. ZOR0017]|uniref:phosphate/phosphite/phosphonate ABC transporter substrate-binding protein n=1 Tax=Chitinibacter sp. ZOR0017 TaxID=1339254 RepID=UPI0018CCEC90|nr:phosphate/phosphite/phosphonate ABC transporter substrate-binding protein [Chitinibacter sp. ZOR0017]
MLKSVRWWVLGGMLLVWLSGASAAPTLTVGLIAHGEAAEAVAAWQPVLDDLAKATGRPVKAVAAKNYSEILDGLKSGQIQVARLGNKVALEAVETANVDVFGQLVLAGGIDKYSSVLITRKDSGIKDLQQVLSSKGRYRYGSGDRKSTSGFLLPQYYAFLKNNIVVEQHFKAVRYGNHQDNFLAVARGEVDVAANNTDDLVKFARKFPQESAKIKVIWQSDAFNFDPLVMRRTLPAELKQAISSFFLQYATNPQYPNAKANLAAADSLAGFKPLANRDLKRIAEVELFYAQFSTTLNTALSQAQKEVQEKAFYRRHEQLIALLGGAR